MPSRGIQAQGFHLEMAQRVLLAFDALDQYSQDLLAKRAKKHSLSYQKTLVSYRIPLSLDFEAEIDQDPDERTSSRTPSSPRSVRYPINTESGKTVYLRPFSASAHCFTQDHAREVTEKELKKIRKPRCASATLRSWTSEVESIPDLDTLCHMEHTGPVLSSLGAPLIVSPKEMVQEHGKSEEKSEVPLCSNDTRPKRTSSSSDKLGCSRAQNITDLSHPSRENTSKAAAVSLCMEDEMKKPDIKIITVRRKTVSGHVQNVSETHPIIYNHHINNLVDFQRNLITRPCYFSSSQRPMSKPFSPVGPRLKNKMNCATDFLRSRRLGLEDTMLKKSKTNQMSSFDNINVILHYLSVDGAKQRVEMAKDGNISKQKPVNNPENRRTSVQDGKPIPISPNSEKDEECSVELAVNGINPKIGMDHAPSHHERSHHASRFFGPNSTRTSSSPIPKPNSVRETHNWSYISISKPLSPPEDPPEPLQKKLSATTSPDLVKDMVASTPKMMLNMKSGILENRNGKSGSSVELNPIGTYLGCERSTEGFQGKTKMEGDGSVESANDIGQTHSPPKSELLEMISFKKESTEEHFQKYFTIPAQRSTTPVINIPTATVDSAE